MIRLVLELEPGSEPISGRVIEDGVAMEFHGWLELAHVIGSAQREAEEC